MDPNEPLAHQSARTDVRLACPGKAGPWPPIAPIPNPADGDARGRIQGRWRCDRSRGSPRRPKGPRRTCYAQPGRRDAGASIKGAAGHLLRASVSTGPQGAPSVTRRRRLRPMLNNAIWEIACSFVDISRAPRVRSRPWVHGKPPGPVKARRPRERSFGRCPTGTGWTRSARTSGGRGARSKARRQIEVTVVAQHA